jgi:hypothetical protein
MGNHDAFWDKKWTTYLLKKSPRLSINDMPPNSLRDPKVGSRAKQRNKKKVGARSLTRNTSRLGRCVGASRWDYKKLKSVSSRWGQLAQPRKEGS